MNHRRIVTRVRRRQGRAAAAATATATARGRSAALLHTSQINELADKRICNNHVARLHILEHVPKAVVQIRPRHARNPKPKKVGEPSNGLGVPLREMTWTRAV